MILAMIVLVLGSSYFLLRSLNTTQIDRNEVTRRALAQAKEALIGRAASDLFFSTVTKTFLIDQPGALPCPDRNNDGAADAIGDSCTTDPNSPNRRVGWLPWRTLELADLRDGYGERLWYALSRSFIDSNSLVINSDTLGELQIVDLATMPLAQENDIVAVIIAPGPVLAGQTRMPADQVLSPTPIDETVLNPLLAVRVPAYLEDENNYYNPTKDNGINNQKFARSSGAPLNTFNDRIAVIRHEDLFTVVENAVARDIETTVKPRLLEYAAAWEGAIGRAMYPYPAPFYSGPGPFPAPFSPGPGRPPGEYCGLAGLSGGLLPVSFDEACVGWQVSSITLEQVGGIVVSKSCSASGASTLSPIATCELGYTGKPSVTLTATALGVAKSLALPVSKSAISVVDKVTKAPVPLTPPPALVQSVTAAGDLTVTYTATLENAIATKTVVFSIPLSFSPLVDNAASPPIGPSVEWFMRNRWFSQTYYAVSPGYLASGTGVCSPLPASPPCLKVTGVTSVDNNKVLLVLAGRALNGAMRPTPDFADYFESKNQTAASANSAGGPANPDMYTYERKLRSKLFNDKIIVVAP